MNEKQLIKAILKNLAKQDFIDNERQQQDQLIKTIAETTGQPEYKVKEALYDAEAHRENMIMIATFVFVVVFLVLLCILAS